ncbi:MAG: hypothetical protein WA111_12100, partial [Methanothrix sp.]
LFSPRYLKILSYIRGYLNPCYMSINGRIVALYPQIKRYNHGVFLLSFRVIAPNSHIDYSVNTLIEYDINLYQYKADYIEVPPEWLKLHIRDLLLWSNEGLINRYKALRTINEINSNIDRKIKEINDGDFKFYISHLEGSGDFLFFDKDSFNGIKDMVISTIYHTINPLNNSIKYVITGPGKEKYHTGSVSVSRPSVYILEFNDQPDSSKEIIEKYKNDIGRIMSRTSFKGDFSGLPEPNLRRLFDDYTLHMNQALTLWILSKKGFNANKDNADANRGHLIYEKQALVESIDYMYTCYRRYAERSYSADISYSSSVNEQLDIIKLKDTLMHSCYAGELDDLHAYAAKIFKLSEIFDNAMANLKLKAELTQTQRNEDLIKLGLAISVLFGLGSLPSFANEIIKPIWKYFNLWLPHNVLSQQIFFILIAALMIFLILFILWRSKDISKALNILRLSLSEWIFSLIK